MSSSSCCFVFLWVGEEGFEPQPKGLQVFGPPLLEHLAESRLACRIAQPCPILSAQKVAVTKIQLGPAPESSSKSRSEENPTMTSPNPFRVQPILKRMSPPRALFCSSVAALQAPLAHRRARLLGGRRRRGQFYPREKVGDFGFGLAGVLK